MFPTQPKPFRVWLKRERERIGASDQELAERARLPLTLLRALEAEVPELPSNSGQRARLVGALVEIENERALARLRRALEAL